MANNVRVVVCSRFAVKFPPRKRDGRKLWQDPHWIDYRIRLFAKLTLRSLKLQTMPDFDIVLKCCEESRPIIELYTKSLEAAGVQFVFDEGAQYLADLPTAIDTLHYIRIDSDDMFANTAVKMMTDALHEYPAVQLTNGFWWNVQNGDIRRWLVHSPPYYGLCCRRDHLATLASVYVHGSRHTTFRANYHPRILQSGQFMFVKHEENHRGRTGTRHGKYRPDRIMPRFGVSYEEWRHRDAILPSRD